MASRPRRRVRPSAGGWRAAVALAACAVSAGIAGLAVAPAAGAATPKVTISNQFGKPEADLTYSTTIHVEGTGFQSIQGGFGGIYVLFGWVSDPSGGSWKPSKGGATGETYRYVPDSEDKDNQGFQRFVSFPGSETEYAANGGLLDADGHWALDMVIPGPSFTAYDRRNEPVRVDCQKVACGIITVGAHGVVNANNESFTPVTFTDIYGPHASPGPVRGSSTSGSADPPPRPAVSTSSSKGTRSTTSRSAPGILTAAGSTTAASSTAPAPARTRTVAAGAPPTGDDSGGAGAGELAVDRDTAVVGRILAFTARGFTPGEQVVVVLDDGVAAVGPITVGSDGSLAALLTLPPAVGVGTHVLRATGSEANVRVEAAFPVRADDNAPAATTTAAASTAADGPSTGAWIFLGASGGVLLLSLVLLTVHLIRRTRPRDDAVPEEGVLI